MTWQVWIDARGGADGDAIAPTTWLGGLSLVARQVRQAARAGAAGATIAVAGPADRASVAHELARRPPPAGFAVEIVEIAASHAPPADAVVLDARALYATDALAAARAGPSPPAPLVALRTPEDLARAEALLLAAARKSVEQDGFISYHVLRPVARTVLRPLLDSGVTANQITAVALASGILAGLLCAGGGYVAALVGGALYFGGAFLDCLDGDIARLRLEGSRLGQWLDSLADDLSTTSMLAGLGIGVAAAGGAPGWAAFGVGGAILFAATEARILWELHRNGQHIDTAQYEWWFGKPSTGLGKAADGDGRSFMAAVGPFLRRDTVVTLTLGFLALGQPRLALLAVAVGNLAMCFLFPVHLVITARRRAGSIARGAG